MEASRNKTFAGRIKALVNSKYFAWFVVPVCLIIILAVLGWSYDSPAKINNGQKAWEAIQPINVRLDSIAIKQDAQRQRQRYFEHEVNQRFDNFDRSQQETKQMVQKLLDLQLKK